MQGGAMKATMHDWDRLTHLDLRSLPPARRSFHTIWWPLCSVTGSERAIERLRRSRASSRSALTESAARLGTEKDRVALPCTGPRVSVHASDRR